MFAGAVDAVSVDLNDELDLTDDLDAALDELESQIGDDDAVGEFPEDEPVAEEQPEAEAASELDIEPELTDAVEEVVEEDAFSLPEEEIIEEEIPDISPEQDASLDDLAAELEAFDLDAADTDDSTDALEAPVAESSEAADDIALDDEFSLGDDFDELTSEFSEMDDVATKLDLAKAYIEMGDLEGAKGILEEVVNEGDDNQQQEAKDLIAGMG